MASDNVNSGLGAHPPPARSGAPCLPESRPRRVVFLEDDPETIAATTDLLQRLGFLVIASSTMAGLRSRLVGPDSQVPDLMISDLHLLEEDGLECVQQLRCQPGWQRVPSLLVTADLGEDVKLRAAQCGVQVLYKPLSSQRLSRALDALLGPSSLT